MTVKGGGHVAQVYAIRQAISKALIAFYQKCKCIQYLHNNKLNLDITKLPDNKMSTNYKQYYSKVSIRLFF